MTGSTGTMTKRFEDSTGEKGLFIYDNDGVDDYYFLNDETEMAQFLHLINELNMTTIRQEHQLQQWRVIAKQMDLQTGSIAYMTIQALNYPSILSIEKDETRQASVKVYVKPDYDELQLKAFMKLLPLGTTCRFITVRETKEVEI